MATSSMGNTDWGGGYDERIESARMLMENLTVFQLHNVQLPEYAQIAYWYTVLKYHEVSGTPSESVLDEYCRAVQEYVNLTLFKEMN